MKGNKKFGKLAFKVVAETGLIPGFSNFFNFDFMLKRVQETFKEEKIEEDQRLGLKVNAVFLQL